MHTVTIEIPDELSKEEVLLPIVKELFDKGLLSAKQAAKMAGVNEKEFITSELPKDQSSRTEKRYETMEEVLQEQIKRQGYTGLNKEKMDAIRDRLDIQEPFELLLSQLTK
ncbi:MAG: hypothetical protein BGO21_12385 [Dyadobacter sp. 50-39]|uniref:hypothetical protein n=1 Tax=Dyadobacter sp. 50-39 TaxID=1895756 RepID=UPI00095CC55B|nr:hypothetical protein [Dyadobacter sp. 50-39]OJV20169.1 MAG: hypothetical protein BGO21_12385 [Dyadobacter sp. 50-39]